MTPDSEARVAWLAAARANASESWAASGKLPYGSWDADEALEEAKVAAEQITLPLLQAVELLPRSHSVIQAQINYLQEYGLKYEIVDEFGYSPRVRILPEGWKSGPEETLTSGTKMSP